MAKYSCEECDNGMILNDIKNKFRLVNAYEDWKDYRLLLTDTAIEAGGGDSTKTLCVIGAGCCNDIDIRRLSAAFEKIYLVDCDTEALGEAAKTDVGASVRTSTNTRHKTFVSLPSFIVLPLFLCVFTGKS